MKTENCADFKAFFRSLSPADKTRFAERAGTTKAYITVHLVYARRTPRKEMIDHLFEACQEFGASFDKPGLIGFFYQKQAA